jgi:hypothetical protein
MTPLLYQLSYSAIGRAEGYMARRSGLSSNPAPGPWTPAPAGAAEDQALLT